MLVMSECIRASGRAVFFILYDDGLLAQSNVYLAICHLQHIIFYRATLCVRTVFAFAYFYGCCYCH